MRKTLDERPCLRCGRPEEAHLPASADCRQYAQKAPLWLRILTWRPR